jgi:very-short-patch-repair endonuclease
MLICEFCGKNIKKNTSFGGHKNLCKENPNSINYKRILNKKKVERDNKITYHHTNETKKILSEKRKLYLKNNRNNHNWSKYKNIESLPEKLFKELFSLVKDYEKFQYYTPENFEYNYEMDFAIPELKVCYEINGNQHYDKNNNLTYYYQKRHDYILNMGWSIFEIPYLECFNSEKIKNLIFNSIKMEWSDIQDEINNFKLIRRKKHENIQINRMKLLYDFIIQKYNILTFKDLSFISKCESISYNRIKRCIRRYNMDLYENMLINRTDTAMKNKETRIHMPRSEYFETVKTKYNETQYKYIDIILYSDINFSKYGWATKVGKILNIAPQKVHIWMTRFMNDFYINKCYKRISHI